MTSYYVRYCIPYEGDVEIYCSSDQEALEVAEGVQRDWRFEDVQLRICPTTEGWSVEEFRQVMKENNK
jgi:hypothetical protein